MKFKKAFLWIVFGCMVALLLFVALRNTLLNYGIRSFSNRLEERFGLHLTVNNAAFNGLVSVRLSGIALVPESGDTLFQADSLMATPSIASLLFFNFRLKSLQLRNGSIRLSCHVENCNYSKLLAEAPDDGPVRKIPIDYAKILRRLFYKAFDLAPQDALLKDLALSFSTDSFESKVVVPHYLSSEEEMSGSVLDVNTGHQWQVTGSFDQDHQKLQLNLISLQENSPLPLMKELFQISSGFDTLHVAIDDSRTLNEAFAVTGEMAVSGFSLFHPKISEDTVKLQKCIFRFVVNAGSRSIAIDSASSVLLDRLPIHPFFQLTRDQEKIYTIDLHTDTVPATDFFQSLPEGVFDETRDIKASGTLMYSLHFRLDASMPDSLEFESRLKKDNFQIKKSGKEDLFKMNSEFEHTVYEYGRPFRTFVIGPSNPDFTPLDQTGMYLRNAILTSEDGNFFFHNGFNEEAFRKSIAENFRKGRFVRGGSTISMQLIKNVFLSRRKTIARKAEEALLVWLIDGNRLSSKERMFEVYLNIIELAPGIYGVGEASRFYFDKKPAELSLSESIFLASLLPHPKWFRYSFDEEGNLKPYLADYYRVVANFMLRKNLITQEAFDSIVPNVELKGIAREQIIRSDSIPEEVQ